MSEWKRLERYLLTGSEEGTYRVGRFNAGPAPALDECLREDGPGVVRILLQFQGFRREPSRYALARAASPQFADADTNAYALSALKSAISNASDLLQFAEYVSGLRGWGRGLRNAIADWYVEKPLEELSAVLEEAAESDGKWSHRDLLRLSHPAPVSREQEILIEWAVSAQPSYSADLPERIQAIDQLRRAGSRYEVVQLIEEYGFGVNAVPKRWKRSDEVWEALFERMSYESMLDNLDRMTGPGSLHNGLVAARLVDRARISRSGIDAFHIFCALERYRASEEPVEGILVALEEAFSRAAQQNSSSDLKIGVIVDEAIVDPAAHRAALALSRTLAPEASVSTASNRLRPGHEFDFRVVITDHQPWPAAERQAVVALSAREYPNTPPQWAVVGFDETVPAALHHFSAIRSETLA